MLKRIVLGSLMFLVFSGAGVHAQNTKTVKVKPAKTAKPPKIKKPPKQKAPKPTPLTAQEKAIKKANEKNVREQKKAFEKQNKQQAKVFKAQQNALKKSVKQAKKSQHS